MKKENVKDMIEACKEQEVAEIMAEEWVNIYWPDDRHKQGCALEALAGEAERGTISLKYLCIILRTIAVKMK